jgi:hypothetical protein
LRYVGVVGDDGALVVETDGERFRLRVDDDVRAAVTGRGHQLVIPVESALTPREIQDRLRHGASSVQLAEATGVPVQSIARFEAPVLAERAHHADMARRSQVDGRRLDEIVADHLAAAGLDPLEAEWDSWRRADGSWLVQVAWDETERRRSARWSWAPETRRLRPLDPQAQAMLREASDDDELTAVLRPVRSAQLAPYVVRPEPEPEPEPESELASELPSELTVPKESEEPGQEPGQEHEASVVDVEEEPRPAVTAPRPARKRRVSVPSWDEIAGGRRGEPPA